MAGLNRAAWLAQRAAAEERESVVAELECRPSGAQSASYSVLQVSDSDVLDRITERLTSKLKEELRTEVRREEQEASRKKVNEAKKMEGFLAAELEQTTCPICYEIMQPPKHTPILLFPCGHTFCTTCVDGHIKANRKTCPYCRHKIESQAPNMILQQLIEGFTTQKAQAAAASKQAGKTLQTMGGHRSDNTEEEKENSRQSHIAEQLSGCSDENREQLEQYIREWNAINVRWKIYENESVDCQQELQALRNKKEAGKLVHKHLVQELADAERRLELIKQEIELVHDQIEQQNAKDGQTESEILEKAKRQQLIASTRDGLATERAKIKLMVKHFAPPSLDIETILNK